ncbi:hypothetical protein [Nitratireductor luteus]|uniref:hypothetical protein n=1 Tax=Nitratireductor luteus TaxID=2976980 RepID=UPI00223F588C|nr:hypothetical protein [Nitratireductor luteus]
MEKIRGVAFVCIGRAVMFGALAIGLIMISFSFDLVLALYAGAILTMAMSEILIIKAIILRWQNPRRTEVWTCLDPSSRPVGTPGQAVFRVVLRDVYGFFARNSYTIACSFFAASTVLRLAGVSGV